MSDIRRDCLDAYDYIQTRLNEDLVRLSHGITIDTSRVALLGSSAGGYLAFTLVGFHLVKADVRAERCQQISDLLLSDPIPTMPKAVVVTYALTDSSSIDKPRALFQDWLDADVANQESYQRLINEEVSTGWASSSRRPETWGQELGDEASSDRVNVLQAVSQFEWREAHSTGSTHRYLGYNTGLS